MVCEWGMSEHLGMVEYGDAQEHVFLARDMTRGRDYSEATAQKIDAEVKQLIDTAYQRSKDVILKRRVELDAIAKALLEFETLDGTHIAEIMEHGRIMNPPRTKPPTPPPAEAPTPRPAAVEPDEELPGGLAGAPA